MYMILRDFFLNKFSNILYYFKKISIDYMETGIWEQTIHDFVCF